MCTHQAHGSYMLPIYVILVIFWSILPFSLWNGLLLNYNYLSIFWGDLIFMLCGLPHICYEIIKSESWLDYHHIWNTFSYNIHKNRIFFFKISKNRSAEISGIIIYDFKWGPRTFPFSFRIYYPSNV